jgi:purine-binding chemotaxis protein CheW
MAEAKVDSEVTESLLEYAGKYLTFKLGDEEYGLEILKVQEIIGAMEVTRVPRTPEYVRGVINLRGKVIPVIDIRKKFGLEVVDETEKTCIIVVQVEQGNRSVTMSIVVDEVSEVLDIDGSQLEPTPEFGSTINTDFILAMGKVGEKVVMLLGIDKVLSTEEIKDIEHVGK